jgi:predicted transcriptional regulator of viral defense system
MATSALTVARLEAAGLGAFFRPRDVKPLGIPFAEIQRAVVAGDVEKVGPGLYRLTEADLTENYSRAGVCARVPGAILCLITALNYHGIGTQLPYQVWFAISRKARTPRVPEVPVEIVRFSGIFLHYGVDSVRLEGVACRITNPARTVIDCFRFRRLVGHDVALEALKYAVLDRIATPAEIWRTAEVCRARTLVRPYLEFLSV